MKMIVSLFCIELETNFISKSWRRFRFQSYLNYFGGTAADLVTFFFFSPRPCNQNYIIYTPVFNRFPVYKLEKCRTKGPSPFYYLNIVSPLSLLMMSLLICLYRGCPRGVMVKAMEVVL